MTDSLALEFTVAASPDHAFTTWTGRMATWWPAAKTVSGAPAAIEVEPRVGGRIVERDPAGAEHVWGQVLAWEPPYRLAFTWHLFFDPAEATEVEVTFRAVAGGTTVGLVQRGFDRLGAAGAERRDNTLGAWRGLMARYAVAL